MAPAGLSPKLIENLFSHYSYATPAWSGIPLCRVFLPSQSLGGHYRLQTTNFTEFNNNVTKVDPTRPSDHYQFQDPLITLCATLYKIHHPQSCLSCWAGLRQWEGLLTAYPRPHVPNACTVSYMSRLALAYIFQSGGTNTKWILSIFNRSRNPYFGADYVS